MHPDRFEPLSLGAGNAAEDVELHRTGRGAAFFSPKPPAGMGRLTQTQKDDLADIQEHVLRIEGMQQHLDELVLEARSAGISWNLIGWSLGMTGEGARTRWGGTS